MEAHGEKHLFGNYQNFHNLDQNGKIIAEYIWLDGSGVTVRSKQRTLEKKIEKLEDLPSWNYDGSSCYQAITENSEVIVKPVAFYRDPFRQGDNVLVMCEAYNWKDHQCSELVPANTNFRHFANKIFDHPDVQAEETWFGIEQEYTLIRKTSRFTSWPLGWPDNQDPQEQGPYYCSVGANVCFGRIIADNHYRACLYAGINISGTNGEVMPGQWEYQVGPCTGISAGDQLWMARYLLARVAEDFNVSISIAPKLFADWNGSGCHTNFSTETMRQGTKGMKYIEQMMEKFSINHKLHISLFGQGNEQRLTGIHETSSVNNFSYGVGNRAASFRIPTATAKDNGKGYIEDRRPSSNMDPYVVTAIIADSALLKESMAEGMVEHYTNWKTWKDGVKIISIGQ